MHTIWHNWWMWGVCSEHGTADALPCGGPIAVPRLLKHSMATPVLLLEFPAPLCLRGENAHRGASGARSHSLAPALVNADELPLDLRRNVAQQHIREDEREMRTQPGAAAFQRQLAASEIYEARKFLTPVVPLNS